MTPRRVSDSRSTLVRFMGVPDTNTGGFVHGGTVLRLVDEAAALAAMRHCRHAVVTAGLDRTAFLHRVEAGELLTLNASVNAVWRTSMEVGVRVEAEDPKTGERRHTNSAYLTMVAIDGQGRPVEVPPIAAESPEEERRMRAAQLRRSNRLAEREHLAAEAGG